MSLQLCPAESCLALFLISPSPKNEPDRAPTPLARPWTLDEAVLRRFGLQYEVGLPGVDQRREILSKALRRHEEEMSALREAGALALGDGGVEAALLQDRCARGCDVSLGPSIECQRAHWSNQQPRLQRSKRPLLPDFCQRSPWPTCVLKLQSQSGPSPA